MKSESELKQAGFTDSGAKRYIATSTAYCNELLAKSVALGDIDKAPDTATEVTHDHVRSAAEVISARGKGSQGQTLAQVWCQVGEYICAALAGVGGGELEKPWGVVVFGLSLTVGVILFVVRNTRSTSK